jgi:ferritin-like metal-binding protein YciE
LAFVGNMAAMGHAVASDEIVKNSFANNAFENYEIAAYRSLIALADHLGINGAVLQLKISLEEEEQMAKWVDSNVGKITLAYVERSA